ncbi:MAG: AI-2E family transporter [Erysipelotrichales bacterium]|nr:AI-2E family transporter [Erysipelotrichales bacterium]
MKQSLKLTQLTLKDLLLAITYIALLILGIINLDKILALISTLFEILKPFIIGFILAFILNIPMKWFIKKLPIQNDKNKKLIAALLSILLIFSILFVVIMIVLPQVIENIRLMIDNLPSTLKQVQSWIEYVSMQIDISQDVITQIEDMINDVSANLPQKLSLLVPDIAIMVSHFTTGVINIFMGIVIAVYMILSKDKLLRQTNKLGKAFLSDHHYNYVKSILQLTSDTFENFLAGQMVESLIIGVLCYIGCIILKIPYASIAAVVIGFTNVIPYFGPIIGAFISSILILLVSPMKAVVFLIFSSLLQQFESNLIYPHVVGSSVGLSALWVLFAVSAGGGLFGIPGMVFGLPTFSVIYELIRRWTNLRLKQKKEIKVIEKEIVNEKA